MKKIFEIKELWSRGSGVQAIKMYEGVSEQITQAQKHSEQTCGILQHGHSWSPQLQEAVHCVLHWTRIISALKHNVTNSIKTKHEHQTLGSDIQLPCTMKCEVYEL